MDKFKCANCGLKNDNTTWFATIRKIYICEMCMRGMIHIIDLKKLGFNGTEEVQREKQK